MQRHHSYAWAGGLLSAGAPFGLLGLRLAFGRRSGRTAPLRRAREELAADVLTYSYVSMSTAAAFALFGYVLGRQADRLASLSRTDDLTGLTNARGLFEHLDAELARSWRQRTPLALLLVDLDGLKRINDEHGHHAGDQAIRDVAGAIRSQLRATDTGARWGGDEFAIVAPATSHAAAEALAERIRVSIPQRSTKWRLSGSVGIAIVDPERHEPEHVDSAALMRLADAALYDAKRSGRNRVVTGVAAAETRG